MTNPGAHAPGLKPFAQKPGVTLWQYGEQVRANWKDAEAELVRAARWLALLGTIQVLTLVNLQQFGPKSPTTSLKMLSLDVTVPGYWLAIALPVATGYWVSQYMHNWVSTKLLLTVNQAVVRRLLRPEIPISTLNRGKLQTTKPSWRGSPGAEVEDVQLTLTPTGSVAGRLPTTFGVAWREDIGTRFGGLTVMLLAMGFDMVVYWVLLPFGAGNLGPDVIWFVSIGATLFWLGYANGFRNEPRRWIPSRIEALLKDLERDGRIGR